MFHREVLHRTFKITPKYVYIMHVHQCDVGKENSREILKAIGYVISLDKSYFKVKDLTNMLAMKPNGRHKLSHSLKTLVSQKQIEIYHKNSRNLYYIPVQKKLQDAYYEFLWNHAPNHVSQCTGQLLESNFLQYP